VCEREKERHKNSVSFAIRQTTMSLDMSHYGAAALSNVDQIIGLSCKRALQKSRYSAKETYNFIDPTIRSHPI